MLETVPTPAAEIFPENVAFRVLLTFAASVRVGCASIPSASTVPAGFGVAVPGTYGVKMLGQIASGDVDAAKMPSTVKFTSSSFAPKAAPPADCGMSGEGRQTVSLPEPNAVSVHGGCVRVTRPEQPNRGDAAVDVDARAPRRGERGRVAPRASDEAGSVDRRAAVPAGPRRSASRPAGWRRRCCGPRPTPHAAGRR